MRLLPPQPFSNAWAEAFLSSITLDFAIVYQTRFELDQEYSTLINFHKSGPSRSGFQLRIEKTKRTPWLELSCWSRNRRAKPPSICYRLPKYAGDRWEMIRHLQRCEKIEVRFVCLEDKVGINNSDELEVIDKAIKRIRDGHPCLAAGTAPIELRQMRIFGKTHRASYAESYGAVS